MSLNYRKLRYCIIRQYYNIDVYEYTKNKLKDYDNYNDYAVDMVRCNYQYTRNKDFNFISKKRFVIENKDKSYVVMYVIYRLFDKKVIYGITDVAIEFNPEKDILLYYQRISVNDRFVPRLLEFYFENRPKDFYARYDPMYHGLFNTKTGRKPDIFYEEFETKDYETFYFDYPKIPDNFKLTKQNTNIETRSPIALRNFTYNTNIERLLENTYYNRRRRQNYLEEYNNTRVTNYYDINNPESMFFDLREDSTADLSYMYINGEKFNFNKNAEHINVPKGDYCLYYNKRDGCIGIRYVNPIWFGDKKPNPLLRSYVYIKRLSNKDKKEKMKEYTIDLYTKDNFHLHRLKYTNKDIKEMNDVYVFFYNMKQKFDDYKKNYYLRERILHSWTDRNNPYLEDRIRYQY